MDRSSKESNEIEPALGKRLARLQWLLVVLLLLSLVSAAHATASVTMPLAFALFIVVLFAPWLGILRRFMPKWLAVATTFLSVLAVMGGLGAGLWACADRVSEVLPAYREVLSDAMSGVSAALQSLGLPGSGFNSTSDLAQELSAAAGDVASRLADAAGGFVFVVTFAMLALSETDAWEQKLRTHYGEGSLRTAREISQRCRRYIVTRTLTSALTGLLTGVLALAVGLDLAFVWGMLAFLLNFIPTLGSVVAIIPPTLMAVVQLGGLGAFGFFVGLTVIQIVLGSYIDPKLQGKSLQLSPFVVLLSIGVWGYLWGVGGALLAVPMTVACVAVCAQFPRSRWLADMLADEPRLTQRGPKRRRPVGWSVGLKRPAEETR